MKLPEIITFLLNTLWALHSLPEGTRLIRKRTKCGKGEVPYLQQGILGTWAHNQMRGKECKWEQNIWRTTYDKQYHMHTQGHVTVMCILTIMCFLVKGPSSTLRKISFIQSVPLWFLRNTPHSDHLWTYYSFLILKNWEKNCCHFNKHWLISV